MGRGTWSDDTYAHISSGHKTKTADQIFINKATDNLMSPFNIKFRESRDTPDRDKALAIMFWLDVTASLGSIPEDLVRNKLGSLMKTLIAHGIEQPQVFFGAIGDHISDKAPLQIGQFESAATELDQWLTKIFLERGGGGQTMESYLLAWLFAARHTSIDCFEKRNQKGFLFTTGDEWTWDKITADQVKEIFGETESQEVDYKDVLKEAQRMYHVFHIHLNEGSYKNDPEILGHWKELLGERLIICEDHSTVAEIVASTVAVMHGADLKNVVKSFDVSTANSVSRALAKVTRDVSAKGDTGIIAL